MKLLVLILAKKCKCKRFYILEAQPNENGAPFFPEIAKSVPIKCSSAPSFKAGPIAHRKSKSALFLGFGQNPVGNC
jgi:hypothetical protein